MFTHHLLISQRANQCGTLFGGMDILAIDLLVDKDGKEIILEVNDCSIGLVPDNEDEDMKYMRDLLLDKVVLSSNALVPSRSIHSSFNRTQVLKQSVTTTTDGEQGRDHVGAVLDQLAKVKAEHKRVTGELKKQLAEVHHRGDAATKFWRGIAIGAVVACLSCVVALGVKSYH